MTKEQIFEQLSFSVVKGDKEMARQAAREVIEQTIDPVEAIERGLSRGMEIIGERFSKMEVFLRELLMAAQAFDTAMEVLEPEIAAQKKEVSTRGTIVMGTVKGDVHSIGKDIVVTMLRTGGFEVHDLGVDVSPLSFVEAAQKNHADISGGRASQSGVGRPDRGGWVRGNGYGCRPAGKRAFGRKEKVT